MSKIFRAIFVICCLAFAAERSVAVTMTGPTDESYSKSLPGNWRFIVTDQNLPTIWGFMKFHSNGTYTARGAIRHKDGTTEFEFAGKWRIENGALIEKVTHSTEPKIVAIGCLSTDKIQRLDSEMLVTLNEYGISEQFKREKLVEHR